MTKIYQFNMLISDDQDARHNINKKPKRFWYRSNFIQCCEVYLKAISSLNNQNTSIRSQQKQKIKNQIKVVATNYL